MLPYSDLVGRFHVLSLTFDLIISVHARASTLQSKSDSVYTSTLHNERLLLFKNDGTRCLLIILNVSRIWYIYTARWT